MSSRKLFISGSRCACADAGDYVIKSFLCATLLVGSYGAPFIKILYLTDLAHNLCAEIAVFVLNLSDIIFLRMAPHRFRSGAVLKFGQLYHSSFF